MKKTIQIFATVLIALVFLSFDTKDENNYGMTLGTPDLKSISNLAFGPDGILFIGDSRGASIIALNTGDKSVVATPAKVEIKNADHKIAAALGTEPANIRIKDMVVNPLSKKIYCGVEVADGTPVILTISGEDIALVKMDNVLFSETDIALVHPEDQKDRGGRPLRDQSISDMAYSNGHLLVSGISTKEFSSTFRKIKFPFSDVQDHATLEIFHAAHGKYETNSPIRTFTSSTINGKEYLIASYTCTPLVLFPMDQLKSGEHVKGRTIAEFGAGNSPIDIVTIKKGDNTYLVMANNNRPVMRVNYNNIAAYQGNLTEPIKESFSTAGVDFVTLPVVNVLQMDQMDDKTVVVLQRKSNGDLDINTLNDWYF